MSFRAAAQRVLGCICGLLLVQALIASGGIADAAPAGSGCEVTGPSPDHPVTGPVTITGTYTDAYRVQVGFDAGRIFDAQMVDPDADDTGTWSFTLDPASAQLSGMSGRVEVTVRCSSVETRYWLWGDPVFLDVQIPELEAPTVAVTSPQDGATARGVLRVRVAATDAQGLASVQVRVDSGRWKAARRIRPGRYVHRVRASGADRTHSIEARATDVDGNISTSTTTYVKTGTGTSEPPAVQQSDRAIWVWEAATAQLLENPGAREVLGQYMDDTSLAPQQRSTIYLYADRYDDAYALLEHPQRYRSLIAWAHDRGYRVHALIGSGGYLAPMLVYRRHHDKAIRLVETVLNYNLAAAPDERFDGINVDIEPHVLADWHTDRQVQLQYLDMLAAMMERKQVTGQNLAIGPAIPRWLDDSASCQDVEWRGKTQNCARHVIDITDYISLMDYRDVATGPAGIIPQARHEIDYAARVGKQVMIGVETDQLSASGDPEVITFSEEGRIAMEAELAQVYDAFRAAPSFLGIAMHHYDSLRALPSRWSPDGTRWQHAIPDSSGPTSPGRLTAETFDWQRVDLHWARSSDATLVDHYELHRSTEADFTPGPDTLARTTGANFVTDRGLRPQTTYYWRVVAVDASGNRSTPSAPVSATTPEGAGLTPLRVDSIAFTDQESSSTATVTVVNAVTGEPVPGATVFGHWEGAAGRKFDLTTGADGTASATTEALVPPYTVSFVPERILAPGHYWASSLDRASSAAWDRR